MTAATQPSPPRPVPTLDGRRARRDAGVRTGALDATWSGLLLVAYRWTAGGGIQDQRSCADG